ncbi:ABC transporter permease [Youhaiella tibetensis]|uniref:DMT family transporter n=1 Tax=Paradevosia tibetensis TaxID=1447062 RepID=A0A5B9DRD1_9HYPH|nr:DMT family transporter [Youhaiella tibetensis]QEE21008.1 DMT family transporter [Youhaiella tibetensis]GGF18981.1 ABC transporter permease [Youhaiella tibetensis]
MQLRDWFWVILVGSIWGCSFLFNAVLLREVGPIWVSAGRVTIAAIGCWAFFFALGKKVPTDLSLWIKLMILGIFSYAVPFTLFPLGQTHIASGLTAIINAMTPITTVVVSHFWPGGEKATANKAMGVLAGFAGASLLAFPALQQGGTTQLWAILVCFCATLCYAVTLNTTRAFVKIDPTTIATIAMTGAAVTALPVAFIFEGVPHATRIETWGAWLGLGLLASTFTFQIMYRMLPRIGVTNFAVNTFITPVFAIILGVIFLGETILPIQFFGMLVIFLGLLLIDGRIVRRFQRAPA